MLRFSLLAAVTGSLFFANVASAHYLWVVVDGKNQANIYFEGGPAPGDGHYLDPVIKRGKTWVRTGGSKAKLIKTVEVKQPKKRWLRGTVTGDTPRSVDSNFTFGTYNYNKVPTLLHYYARHLTLKKRNELESIAKAPHLEFCIVPRVDGDKIVARVLFKGKPAKKVQLKVYGGGLKINSKTDDQGELIFEPKKPGMLRLHAYLIFKGKSGEFDGNKYKDVRHHSTLLVRMPKK